MIIDLKFSEEQLVDFTTGYQTKILDDKGKEIDNPQKREEFAMDKIKDYIHSIVSMERVNKATDTARSNAAISAKVDLASLKVVTTKEV